MSLSKLEIVYQALKDGQSVKEINQAYDISKSYIYQIKRRKIKNKLLDVTTMIKKSSVNDFYLKGIHIKCNDEVLIKVVKVLIDD
jgi:Mor family transcriptional regulator